MVKSFSKLLSSLTTTSDLLHILSESLTSDCIINTIDSNSEFRVVKSAEGKLSTVENMNNINDWGKNNALFPFHLDGAYYPTVPRYAILYCIRPSLEGGNTFFTKAESVIDKLESKYDSNFLKSLYIIYVSPEKKKYKKPLIEEVENGKQLNWYSSLYIEPDPQSLSSNNRRILTQLLGEFINDVEHYLKENVIYSHKWKKNDLVLFNNQLLLHGRDKITDINNNRLLYRIWFDTKDFLEIRNPIE
jgi:alpha-ketoglutarate-dependent taurine dioxygenase